MWEKSGRGKIGLEAYYTGRQLLEDNPYRSRSRPYFELGAMGELILGRISLFINAEDLLDIRQTKYVPLLLPQRAPDGAWTVDAWAPLEGRVIRSEEHTSELQSLMRISYAVFCLKKTKTHIKNHTRPIPNI